MTPAMAVWVMVGLLSVCLVFVFSRLLWLIWKNIHDDWAIALVPVILALFASPIAHADCRRQAMVKKQVVQQVVTPVAVTALAVQVPTYSVGYAPVSDAGIIEELRRIREALERLAGQQPQKPAESVTVAGVLGASCLKCHAADKAEKDGGAFVLIEKDGKVPPLSVVEKKRMIRRVQKGDMPPKSEKPLTEAEKKALIDWLSQ